MFCRQVEKKERKSTHVTCTKYVKRSNLLQNKGCTCTVFDELNNTLKRLDAYHFVVFSGLCVGFFK